MIWFFSMWLIVKELKKRGNCFRLKIKQKYLTGTCRFLIIIYNLLFNISVIIVWESQAQLMEEGFNFIIVAKVSKNQNMSWENSNFQHRKIRSQKIPNPKPCSHHQPHSLTLILIFSYPIRHPPWSSLFLTILISQQKTTRKKRKISLFLFTLQNGYQV